MNKRGGVWNPFTKKQKKEKKQKALSNHEEYLRQLAEEEAYMRQLEKGPSFNGFMDSLGLFASSSTPVSYKNKKNNNNNNNNYELRTNNTLPRTPAYYRYNLVNANNYNQNGNGSKKKTKKYKSSPSSKLTFPYGKISNFK